VNEICSLGIWYYALVKDIIVQNHKFRIEELEKLFTRWRCRKLSLYGKATVIKTLAVSKLNHVIANLCTPEWFVKHVQKLIFDFLWDSKPPKIKNKVIINTVDNGGLRIPEIETLVKAQKAAWIKRIVNNPQTAWLQYLYQSLPSMSIADLPKCLVKPEDLASNLRQWK
jgi:hypothetical protein